MNVIVRILIVLIIFAGAGWLLFSLTSGLGGGVGNHGESNSRQELKPIKHEKLEGNYKKVESEEKTEEPVSVEKIEKLSISIKEDPKPTLIEKKESTMEEQEDDSETVRNDWKYSGEMVFAVVDWKLLGEFKNALLLEAKVKNGMDSDVVNKDILFSCTISDGSVIEKTKRISVNSKDEFSFSMIMGYVDPNITSVNCTFKDEEKTPISRSRNIVSEQISQPKKEEFIIEDDGFPLPNF